MLNRQLSIRQLFHLATAGFVVVVLPYLLIGGVWAYNHSSQLDHLSGADKVFSMIGEVIAWPVLLVADVQLR
ncbi:hypothetical protein [Gordonia crocea]|uniref:hypothetical protein n=1 Tax=Gordonia crocea TaxID=589162 RepID=UPI001E3EF071|nr:hypothetical protein [Gordonia crocea]